MSKHKIRGCKQRIGYAEYWLETLLANRGSLNGTFWKDLEGVDKAIVEQRAKIDTLHRELHSLMHPEILLNQLKTSEIF